MQFAPKKKIDQNKNGQRAKEADCAKPAVDELDRISKDRHDGRQSNRTVDRLSDPVEQVKEPCVRSQPKVQEVADRPPDEKCKENAKAADKPLPQKDTDQNRLEAE